MNGVDFPLRVKSVDRASERSGSYARERFTHNVRRRSLFVNLHTCLRFAAAGVTSKHVYTADANMETSGPNGTVFTESSCE